MGSLAGIIFDRKGIKASDPGIHGTGQFHPLALALLSLSLASCGKFGPVMFQCRRHYLHLFNVDLEARLFGGVAVSAWRSDRCHAKGPRMGDLAP